MLSIVAFFVLMHTLAEARTLTGRFNGTFVGTFVEEGTGNFPPITAGEYSNPECLQKPFYQDIGDGAGCMGHFPKFSYDQATQQCQSWIYGGCGGNSNQFDTFDDCTIMCSPLTRCLQTPFYQGTFDAQCPTASKFLPSFSYDQATQQCQSWVYYGCNGCDNRYDTIEDCSRSCIPPQVPEIADPCKEEPFYEEYAKSCAQTEYIYSYDQVTKQCTLWAYGGCNGNNNRFNTNQECMKKCHPAGYDPCKEDPFYVNPFGAICSDYPSTKKFSYDPAKGKCAAWRFGDDCVGNGNNFATKRECSAQCEK